MTMRYVREDPIHLPPLKRAIADCEDRRTLETYIDDRKNLIVQLMLGNDSRGTWLTLSPDDAEDFGRALMELASRLR